jgi:hypothetical protein
VRTASIIRAKIRLKDRPVVFHLSPLIFLIIAEIVLGDAVANVLSTGPNFRKFNPGRGR